MKSLLQKIVLCAVLLVTLTFFYAFKQYQKVKTATDVFNSMVKSILYNDGWTGSALTDWPDTTLVFKKIKGTDTVLSGPQTVCGQYPGGIYLTAANAIGEYDEFKGYTPAYKTTYKQLFGKDLLGAPLILKEKNYEGKPQYFNQFKGDGLLAAFNKLYKKPDFSFEGIAMQHMYNLTVAEYMQDLAQTIHDVMKKKTLFVQLAAQYKREVISKTEFDGVEFAYNATEKLLAENAGDQCLSNKAQLVGMMLRRQVDGSLPTVVNCINKVLKDYDPAFKVK